MAVHVKDARESTWVNETNRTYDTAQAEEEVKTQE
jgi:hypothetical protein